jgi:hypothetical protein
VLSRQLLVVQPQRSPGGQAGERGGQPGDRAAGAWLVEEAPELGEAVRFAGHQAAQLQHAGLDHRR